MRVDASGEYDVEKTRADPSVSAADHQQITTGPQEDLRLFIIGILDWACTHDQVSK